MTLNCKIAKVGPHRIESLCCFDDSLRVAYGRFVDMNEEGEKVNVAVWNVIDNKLETIVLKGDFGTHPDQMALYSPGSLLVFTKDYNTLAFYDLAAGQLHLKAMTNVAKISVAKNGLMAVSARTTQVWNLPDRELLWEYPSASPHYRHPVLAELDAPGEHLYLSGYGQKEVSILDTATFRETGKIIPGPEIADQIAISDDKRFLMASGRSPHGGFLFDLFTGKRILKPYFNEEGMHPNKFCFHPNSRLIATAGLSGYVFIFDLLREANIYAQVIGSVAFTCIAFTPDGKKLILGNTQGEIFTLNTEDL